MSSERVSDEIVALWVAVFGEVPSLRGEPDLMLSLVLENVPMLPYGGSDGGVSRPDLHLVAEPEPTAPKTQPARPAGVRTVGCASSQGISETRRDPSHNSTVGAPSRQRA